MSDTVQNYKVNFQFESAMKKLGTFQTKLNGFNKKQENALRRQISLQKQLLALKGRTTPPTTTTPTTAPTGARKGGMDAHVKARTKEIQKQVRLEEQREKALAKAQESTRRTTFWMEKGRNTRESEIKAEARLNIMQAKTAKEVRDILAVSKYRIRVLRQQEKSLKKQNYFLRRMNESSKQFAGNMISAFAIAAGGREIIRTGQNFESVNNTMLAVSENSQQAGENFQFVRDEAYRLGLGLEQSARGFAKMVSARGDMTLEQTKQAFTGIAEMSTLLGLSADESSRAINALQQIDGLPCIEIYLITSH